MRKMLIERRKQKKLTQQDMADKLNIARTTYNSYELGTAVPSVDKALEIKRILKYKNDDLFYDEKCP